MKKKIKKIVGANTISSLRRLKEYLFNLVSVIYNFTIDLLLYFKYSTVFSIDSIKKKEAQIILDYHAIEKGLLFAKLKPRFAIYRIKSLHKYLNDEEIISAKSKSQFEVAYKIMCQYYEIHEQLNISIEDYFSRSTYLKYKEILGNKYSIDFNGALTFDRSEFYKYSHDNFEFFSNSRKSIRHFTGEKIDREIIEKVIKLALNAPSVCNRQPSKVYLIEDKDTIERILQIQGGFSGYINSVSQLLILTTDRKYFYTVGERNQLYIDGGIFLMNLLYALHFYQIANCPANWGKTIQDEKLVYQFISFPKSEKIICMIPIGIADDNIKVCLSKRRDVSEVFETLK